MKNLSFRGKRLDNGEWVSSGSIIRQIVGEGLTIEHHTFIANAGDEFTGIHDAETNNMLSIEQGTFYAVDPETVGQWTGLLDRNGTKVFEGDFVKLEDEVKVTFDAQDGVVKYQGGCFFVGKINMLHSLFVLVDIYYVLRGEVIGNIHDNPELMKGE